MYDPNKIYEVPLKNIYVDEDFNCRGPVNPADVIDLAKDIAVKGLLAPVIVEPWNQDGKEFRLIAGYRRYKAHQVNYKPDKPETHTIRAVVKEGLNEFDARILNLNENIHRQNLNIKQEALAIKPFKFAGWTENEVANQIKQSRGWVQVRYFLLEMPEEIQDEAAAGLLTNANIRELYSLHSVQEQFAFVKMLKDKKLLGKKRDPKPHQAKANQQRIRSVREMEEMQEVIRSALGNNLATKVLGWAMGVNDDLEMHEHILRECQKTGKFYALPEGLKRGTNVPV